MSTTRIRRRTTLAGVTAGAALGAVLLAGCGSAGATGSDVPAGEPAAPPAASAQGGGGPDPCTLLHDDEVSALVHDGVTRSGPADSHRGTVCKWRTADDSAIVSVQVYQGREFYAPDEQAPGARRVSGIGDQAYVGDTMAGALVGGTVVVVDATVYPAHDVPVESALRSAAARVRG